jgi:menaquinone-dependent protoporphyrinogen oxidase
VRVLQRQGLEVDALDPRDVHDLSEYDAVVIGSAVYAGRWLPATTALVDRLASALTERPVWLFSSGPLGEPPTPEDPPDAAGIPARIGVVEHHVFAGKLDHSKLRLLERAMVRMVRAPEGDFRNWADVDGWAAQIGRTLVPETSGAAR